METTKIAANIKASVLWLAIINQRCEGPHGAAGNNQLHPSPASSMSSDVFNITGRHRAIDLLCLTETWHNDDSAVLSRLRGVAYTTSSIVRNPYSWWPVGQPRWHRHCCWCWYRIVADRHCLPADHVWNRLRTCPCRLFRCGRRIGQARSRCSSSRRLLTNWRPCWSALKLMLHLCIVSYRIMIFCVISYHIVSFSLRAILCQHYC